MARHDAPSDDAGGVFGGPGVLFKITRPTLGET